MAGEVEAGWNRVVEGAWTFEWGSFSTDVVWIDDSGPGGQSQPKG
jgi:hypothetical protein